MRRGRLVQAGSAEDLYHRPAALFVARLFSEINEIAYPVRKGAIETPIGSFPAPGIFDGETAILCIRERGIRLNANAKGLVGRVLHVKFLGDAARLEVAVAGFEAPLRVRAHEGDSVEKGAEVEVEIDPARVLVFAENGEETN
jgi:iron(III) transport system ATP-binding protein